MLYRSFYIVAFVAIFGQAVAQIKFIPKAGVNMATLSFSDSPSSYGDFGYKTGIVVGAGLNIPIAKSNFAIQPEMQLTEKGFRSEFDIPLYTGGGNTTWGGEHYDNRQRHYYIDVPLLMKFNFHKFFVGAGPSVGCGIGGRINMEITDHSGTNHTVKGDIKYGEYEETQSPGLRTYYKNRFELALNAAVGVQIWRVLLDLRYAHGLTNLNDDFPDDVAGYDGKTKHRGYQLTIGAPLAIKK